MTRSNQIITLLILISSTLIAQDDLFGLDELVSKTTLGGYGELHYNNSTVNDGDPARGLDFHRFVMFYSHSWTSEWSFKAELELEHNFVSDGEGELELEQAYVNYQRSPLFGLQFGVVLPSVGLINEYHEPPLFFGVERPEYAKYIIPTTWFGNGMAAYGRSHGFDYKLTVMEGLDATGISHKNGIRSARMKGYKSNADQWLVNARLNYVGLPGLKAGLSYSSTTAMGDDMTSDIPLSLFEMHAQLNKANVLATFEYGTINYHDYSVESATGYYLDLGYDLGGLLNKNFALIPWFRVSDYNTAASTVAGGDEEQQYHHSIWKVGLSLKPISEVVFKLDYGTKTTELSGDESTSLNLGVGYFF